MRMTACARAPASIGNVAAGFDCLGLAFGAAWDRVAARREDRPGARLGTVSGLCTSLPETVMHNTALRAAQALLQATNSGFGVCLDLEKGIPLSAGMGGSAASAVAAVLAVNALLPVPADTETLFASALQGERASADPPPPDNVAAALYGNLVLIGAGDPPPVTPLRLPAGLDCLLFHPALVVHTGAARTMLSPQVPLALAVAQMRHLGGLVAGCLQDDKSLIAQNLRDVLVEPQRAALVPPLPAVRKAALAAGALGCSLSGSGPSIFAWVESPKADAVQTAMAAAFARKQCPARAFRAPLARCRAQVLP